MCSRVPSLGTSRKGQGKGLGRLPFLGAQKAGFCCPCLWAEGWVSCEAAAPGQAGGTQVRGFPLLSQGCLKSPQEFALAVHLGLLFSNDDMVTIRH